MNGQLVSSKLPRTISSRFIRQKFNRICGELTGSPRERVGKLASGDENLERLARRLGLKTIETAPERRRVPLRKFCLGRKRKKQNPLPIATHLRIHYALLEIRRIVLFIRCCPRRFVYFCKSRVHLQTFDSTTRCLGEKKYRKSVSRFEKENDRYSVQFRN